MDIQEYEKLITDQLDEIVGNIISQNPKLNIAVKKGERVGDGISKFLENKFVEFSENHQYFTESIASPEGKTKNPFDVQTIFKINDHKELIWIDFKAVNIDNDDTNPDSGTPDKVITLVLNGYFYLAYIIVYYKGLDNGLVFEKNDDIFVKSYFLKNVSPTMRITPANQMQVNGFSETVYRTRWIFRCKGRHDSATKCTRIPLQSTPPIPLQSTPLIPLQRLPLIPEQSAPLFS